MDIVPYAKFRTGYSWRDVSAMVWSYDSDPSTWPKGSAARRVGKRGKYKDKPVGGRRHTILGLWREIKLEMYDRYLAAVDDAVEEVPF